MPAITPPRHTTIIRTGLRLLAAGLSIVTPVAVSAGPIPVGDAMISVSYETETGVESYSGARDFSGVGPVDATNLGAAPNIRAFNSVNTFGRRTVVANNPAYAHVLGSNESLVAHAFFKIDNNAEYFPGLANNGSITLSIQNIQFSEPVTLNEETLMLHVKWNDQADDLTPPYFQIDDHHTRLSTFRDLDSFLASGSFGNLPTPNYILGDSEITWEIITNGPSSFDLSATFPYSVLKNFEDMGPSVPKGYPAPQGFLEPFHFHIEYVVTPEPGTLAILGLACCGIGRRRRRSDHTIAP